MRTLIAAAVAALLVAVGLVTTPAGARYEPYGSISAADQRLKPRCDYYHYRYRITVPGDRWAAETFLIGPERRRIAASGVLAGSDPRTGRDRFRVCRPSLVAGRYKLAMKVTYSIDYEKFEGFVKPSFFRISRR